MDDRKYNIAIVTGGTSAEVEIALKGARVISSNLDPAKYYFYIVNIGEKTWTVELNDSTLAIDKNDFSFIYNHQKVAFDCAFVIIHGKPAENGLLQAYFDLIGLPYTCCGVFASAVTYNKEACKSFVRDLPLRLGRSFILNHAEELSRDSLDLSFPVFVKPNQEGSSYGISRVESASDLYDAVKNAFNYDNQVMVEEAIKGTEITCGLMIKDGQLITLPLTEIVSKKAFFDYEAKYQGAADEITPARIDNVLRDKCYELSKMIYCKVGCKGLVRIDYILKDNEFYLLEVNTIPGLTKESIIPQQAAASGISLSDLFNIQIKEALVTNLSTDTRMKAVNSGSNIS